MARTSTPLLFALLAAPALGQSFDYPDFSDTTGLAMVGNAQAAGNALILTPALNSQHGAVYYDQPVDVVGGFECTFTFSITQSGGGGADGMTFIIQNDAAGLTALGDHGSGMGYAENPTNSIWNALVFEMDTWASGQGDPNGNHVSIHTGGQGANLYSESFSLGNGIPAANLEDGQVHTMVIQFDGAELKVFLDDLVTPLITAPWDFANGGTYIGGGSVGGLSLQNDTSAYVGFTAGTGGANAAHNVLSWTWSAGGGSVGTPFCGPANPNSTGLGGELLGVGSSQVTNNNLRLLANNLPVGSTAMFVVAQNTGFTTPPGSTGNLCLSTPIGRYGGSLQTVGASGSIEHVLDLNSTPTGLGKVAVQAGETWYFQAWHTDAGGSNFTDGLAVDF